MAYTFRYRSGIKFHPGKGFFAFVMIDETRYDRDKPFDTEDEAEDFLRDLKRTILSQVSARGAKAVENVFNRDWKRVHA